MSQPLRAGVVGVGHLGRHHARLFATLPETRLAGVVDVNADQAGAIAAQHGARVFPDVQALAREVDIASIAASTVAHEDVATALLEAGVAVLVEKPIADTVAGGERLVDLARRKGVPLMVGHSERFHPAIEPLVGRLSNPRFIEAHRLALFVPRCLDVDVVLDLMIHDIDMCRYLLGGAEAVSFDASGAKAITPSLDIASVRIRFANGAAANLTASRISRTRMRRVRVLQQGEYLVADTQAGSASSCRLACPPGGAPEVVEEQLPVTPGEPLGRELAAFARAVAAGAPMPVTGEDGLAALRLAVAIRDAIERQP